MASWQHCERCQAATQEARLKSVTERAALKPLWASRIETLMIEEWELKSQLDNIRRGRMEAPWSLVQRWENATELLRQQFEKIGGRSAFDYWQNLQNQKEALEIANALLAVHHAPASPCPSWRDARATLYHWQNWRRTCEESDHWRDVARRVALVTPEGKTAVVYQGAIRTARKSH